jgi:hypothetical protein
MHIDSYSFGNMVIDGTSYANDVIIHLDGIRTNWFRREGHKLYLGDIDEYIDDRCKKLVVGTGASGMMRIMPDLENFCKNARIELIAHPTAQAIQVFNNSNSKHTVGAFHLTC